MDDKIKVQGRFMVQCHNEDGSLAWEEEMSNAVNTAALNDLLATYFSSTAKKPFWYLGLVDNVGWTAFNATDTMALHPTWVENSAYDNGFRVQWVAGTPAGGSIINPTPASFTMTAGAVLKGAFLASDATNGGTTGVLFATGAFSGTQTVVLGQVITVQYLCPMTAT